MTKILVVEDDEDVRGMIDVRLRRLGYRVVCTGSAEEALAVIADKGTPDLVVLDVLMPGMNGLDLLRTLRQDLAPDDLPAVFLSGRVLESDIEAGRALGATYLTKPLVLSALATAVARALEPRSVAAESW